MSFLVMVSVQVEPYHTFFSSDVVTLTVKSKSEGSIHFSAVHNESVTVPFSTMAYMPVCGCSTELQYSLKAAPLTTG